MKREAISIAINNSKGGVGKTTISGNMAHLLSLCGYRVLLADFDSQGSNTEMLKVVDNNGNRLSRENIDKLNVFKMFIGPVNMNNYIFHTQYENLDVIPNAQSVKRVFGNGTFDERFADEGLPEGPRKYLALYDNLAQIRGRYDYIIMDGQPSINNTARITIAACDYVLSPAAADLFNLTPIRQTCEMIRFCNEQLKRNIGYLGFFLNNIYDVKAETYLQLRQYYEREGKKFFDGSGYFIDCPVRFSAIVNKSGVTRQFWFDYAKNRSVILPNPCKDLLKLLYNELGLIEKDHLNELVKNGFRSSDIEKTIGETLNDGEEEEDTHAEN